MFPDCRLVMFNVVASRLAKSTVSRCEGPKSFLTCLRHPSRTSPTLEQRNQSEERILQIERRELAPLPVR
jgi:hypothetical protein